MSVFERAIQINKKGELVIGQWIEWKHLHVGISHCEICKILDKCWFDNSLMPNLPHHSNCHCIKRPIATPIPYVNSQATCDITKFKDYIFSNKYAWNGKKFLFESLGFNISDSEYLKKQYESQAVIAYCKSKYRLGKLDEQGQRINIDIKLIKNGRNITFTSGWMVRAKGVITNNTPLAD